MLGVARRGRHLASRKIIILAWTLGGGCWRRKTLVSSFYATLVSSMLIMSTKTVGHEDAMAVVVISRVCRTRKLFLYRRCTVSHFGGFCSQTFVTRYLIVFHTAGFAVSKANQALSPRLLESGASPAAATAAPPEPLSRFAFAAFSLW